MKKVLFSWFFACDPSPLQTMPWLNTPISCQTPASEPFLSEMGKLITPSGLLAFLVHRSRVQCLIKLSKTTPLGRGGIAASPPPIFRANYFIGVFGFGAFSGKIINHAFREFLIRQPPNAGLDLHSLSRTESVREAYALHFFPPRVAHSHTQHCPPTWRPPVLLFLQFTAPPGPI